VLNDIIAMMNEPPEDKLEPARKRFPFFTSLAVLGPLVFPVVAVMRADHPSEASDWFGASYILPAIGALFAAAPFAIVCSVLAFSRNERKAWFSLLTAVPGMLLILSLLGSILSL
jgi:hypothetical protein